MQKGSRTEKVNFCGSSSTTLLRTNGDTMEDDLNILIVDSTTEAEVLLTTEEATSWLLDSGASYHVTPFRSQFRSYMARNFEPVRVGNSEHCAVVGIGSVELNLPGGSPRCSARAGAIKVAHFGGTTQRSGYSYQLLVRRVESPQREPLACSWSEDTLLVSFVRHAPRGCLVRRGHSGVIAMARKTRPPEQDRHHVLI
jgi:hypothetical protein